MTLTIFERVLDRIASSGDVDISGPIEPCPDEFEQEALPLELDEISMNDAVATCHRIADKMRMYE